MVPRFSALTTLDIRGHSLPPACADVLRALPMLQSMSWVSCIGQQWEAHGALIAASWLPCTARLLRPASYVQCAELHLPDGLLEAIAQLTGLTRLSLITSEPLPPLGPLLGGRLSALANLKLMQVRVGELGWLVSRRA